MREMDKVAAARAAYRIGLIDALLHEDSREALQPPGIVIRSLEGERVHRLRELSAVGVEESDLEDIKL